jgi:hypothetical protein
MNLNDTFWISLFFIIFVFVVSIVLFNLLNALAISDTQRILDEGEVTDLSMKIKVLNGYEKLVAKDNKSVDKFSKTAHKIMAIFGKNNTGTIIIDLVGDKIRLAEIVPLSKNHIDASLDLSVVKKLQQVVIKTREIREAEKVKAEISKRMRNVEKLLSVICEKLNR